MLLIVGFLFRSIILYCPISHNEKDLFVIIMNVTFNQFVTQSTTTKIVASNKPTYHNYSKKSYFATQKQQQPKPKMSNPLELLSGPIDSIQKKYEILLYCN
jgi:hypothetical protein